MEETKIEEANNTKEMATADPNSYLTPEKSKFEEQKQADALLKQRAIQG
jgi:hypothetical protein